MKLFTALIFAFTPILLHAGGDEVVVVYNSGMPESKMVAEHYAQIRDVPTNQIFGFPLTTDEQMSRVEFRDSLQLPLAKKIEEAGLWQFAKIVEPATNGNSEISVRKVVASKIRYAVLCYGVPLKIASDPEIHETLPKIWRTEFNRNEASVDSELAWLPLVNTDFLLTGPSLNRFYCATNAAWLNPTNGILLVTRLDGPSAQIASGLVDKAVQAERNGLWGRGYFDARGFTKTDTNYFLGDAWILGAAEISHRLGYETVVDNKPETFPADFTMSSIAFYAGWYDGNVSGPFTLPKVEFMPGAIAYHLHSFSAATLRSTTENWCGPLLAKGATATMGCVNEPYLAFTPNIAEFFKMLGSGATFGEAAWEAQPALSWQTAVIGDPLYRPFGKSPQLLHTQLLRQNSPLLEWSYLRLADLGLARGGRAAEIAGLIDNLDLTTNSAVLTEKLADLCEQQGKPSSAIEIYGRALKLNPSPQQRIRLRLTLGEKLLEQGRTAEAIDDYKQLLAEAPDYPGHDSILNTITSLQKKIAETNAPAKP